MCFLCGINAGKTWWSIRQRTQRERPRYCRLGRERENEDGERENGVGFKSGTIILVLTDGPKST
jgi:hypothetical protein